MRRVRATIVSVEKQYVLHLTFRGPCIAIYAYNKNQRDVLISQIYFGTELYMFRTVLLSIIRSLVLYTQS